MNEFVKFEIDAFKDVCDKNPTALGAFLEQGALHHAGCYYQYTTLEALQGMDKSRSLFLTRMSLLNDLLECGEEEITKRMYVASFSTRRTESVALWALYGIPARQGLRIRFPIKTIKALKDCAESRENSKNGFGVYAVEDFKLTTLLGIEKIIFTDVIYQDKNTICWRDKRVPGKVDCSELCGRVKSVIWDYEREVRLIVVLSQDVQNPPDKVAIRINNVLAGATIMTGPCFDESQKEVLEPYKVDRSNYFGMIRFKSDAPCKGCFEPVRRRSILA